MLIFEIEQFQKFDYFMNLSIWEISTRIWNKSWEVTASKSIYIKEQIWELVKLQVMRNIEWTKNSKIANFWSQILIFQIGKFFKFLNFPIWTIPKKLQVWKISKIFNLENFKNFQFGEFQKFAIRQIQKNSIWKFLKIYSLEK